jgi:hypothetical protein
MATERLQELFNEGRQVAAEAVENIPGQLASLTSKVTSEVESEAHQVRIFASARCIWRGGIYESADVRALSLCVRYFEAMLETR